MSVFTTVSLQALKDWLVNYDIGEVTNLKGISSGITNTNYFVTTKQKSGEAGEYVLTLFEQNSLAELPYFIDLMTHLNAHHVPCPLPIRDHHHESLHLLNGKPAVLISRLKGADVETPNVQQCAEIGAVLAKLHLAGKSFESDYPQHQSVNHRDAHWRKTTAEKVMPHLASEDQTLLKETMAFQANFDISALPTGVIHADLFRDNVLFDGNHIGGLIDFYYACHDILIYDIAIAVNDWCVNADGSLHPDKQNALLQGYQTIRPFTSSEQAAWRGMLRIAGLRFWLSRLYDQTFPQSGELTHAKDPNHFKQILQCRAAYR